MAAQNLTGELIKADLVTERPYYDDLARYSPNTERLDVYLDCALRLEDGRVCYFKTPKGQRTVTSAISCAVVLYDLEPCKGFIAETEGTRRVATAEESNDNTISPLVKVGDIITIRGSVTEATSRKGNVYLTAKRVKLVK